MEASTMAVCYRHPDRETGVSCANCGRHICPECMTTTPVGMRCPECSRERTTVKTVGSLQPEPRLTYALIGINVLIWLGSFASGGLLNAAGAVSAPLVSSGEVWRLLTSGFLHAPTLPFHLFFNMFALYILGGLLEPAIGRLRFALIYFVSLFAGSLGALLLSPDAPTVGASGAVFGLMGAAVVVMRNRGIDPMQSGLPLWIGLNLLITFAVPGISIGGHLGGLLGGGLTALVLFELPDRVPIPRAALTGLAVALGAAVVAASVAVSAG